MTAGNLKSMSITVEHDPAVGAFSFRLAAGHAEKTVEFGAGVLVDVDSEGRPLTVEVIARDDEALAAAANDLGFAHLLPVMTAALDAA